MKLQTTKPSQLHSLAGMNGGANVIERLKQGDLRVIKSVARGFCKTTLGCRMSPMGDITNV